MGEVRRCLGCSATYPPNDPACPQCGSYAAELVKVEKVEPKPKRKT
jgi:rRNA maturation endonuclease Nob1